MKHDPYLVPDCPCYVWNGDAIILVKELWFFAGYGLDKEPLFKHQLNVSATLLKSFDHYRPLCTEWDFTDGWELCSVVFNNGLIVMFNTTDIHPQGGVWYANEFDKKLKMQYYGYCPDESRYKDGAWKTSLRMRPVWAGGEG